MASSDNASAGEPEIFKARGLVVDTRLQVFGATFLVHSTILKLYSQYFATYMDSADKVKSTTAGDSGLSTAFQYEWVTKVLDGGTDWQLVSAGPKAGDPTVTPSHIDPEKETIAFRNLLNAMYNIPYTLLAEEIIALTKVAAFYMALPVVSRSLKRVFWDSREFIAEEIRNNPCQMLYAAAELRCTELFDDAIIWCLGPFSDPLYTTLQDPKLKRIADQMYHRLKADVHALHYNLMEDLAEDEN